MKVKIEVFHLIFNIAQSCRKLISWLYRRSRKWRWRRWIWD